MIKCRQLSFMDHQIQTASDNILLSLNEYDDDTKKGVVFNLACRDIFNTMDRFPKLMQKEFCVNALERYLENNY